jgi:hypothetical protein
VQALQEYSSEAKDIFDHTPAATETEVVVLAEDILQYALEVAELYPINKRYAGFIDYKRVRWFPTPYGLVPQAFLVDAKASTENNRDTLQQSQLPLDADFRDAKGAVHHLAAGVVPHLSIATDDPGKPLFAVSTSVLVHFYYNNRPEHSSKVRDLRSIFVLALPHGRLQKYNPNADRAFFGQGKHSPARSEVPRIRVYFSRLREMCPWRLQCLEYGDALLGYTEPTWRDSHDGAEVSFRFNYLPRRSVG